MTSQKLNDILEEARIELKNGFIPRAMGPSIPRFGLGLFHNNGWSDETVRTALEMGINHCDTAFRYGTETKLNNSLKQAGKEAFIVTKFWPSFGATGSIAGDIKQQALQSFQNLGNRYIGVYLLHWPSTYGLGSLPYGVESPAEFRRQAWAGMEELLVTDFSHSSQGLRVKILAIGVSNFTTKHLSDIISSPNIRIKPSMNQIEFHPFCKNEDIVRFCREQGILVSGYSSLAKGAACSHPKIVAAAKKVGMSASELVLRWCLSRVDVVLAGMMNAEHLKDNVKCMLPTQADKNELQAAFVMMDGLEAETGTQHVTWDSTNVA